MQAQMAKKHDKYLPVKQNVGTDLTLAKKNLPAKQNSGHDLT